MQIAIAAVKRFHVYKTHKLNDSNEEPKDEHISSHITLKAAIKRRHSLGRGYHIEDNEGIILFTK